MLAYVATTMWTSMCTFGGAAVSLATVASSARSPSRTQARGRLSGSNEHLSNGASSASFSLVIEHCELISSFSEVKFAHPNDTVLSSLPVIFLCEPLTRPSNVGIDSLLPFLSPPKPQTNPQPLSSVKTLRMLSRRSTESCWNPLDSTVFLDRKLPKCCMALKTLRLK